MSHCFGAVCASHNHVLVEDSCPERQCAGGHGFTYVKCNEQCPDYFS